MSRVNAFALLDDSDDESPKVAAPAPAKKEVVKTEKRRPNNNDRNTKGGRGPRVARDGKRTFDRRSGTGRGKETKKGGGGRGNWGSDKDEARKNEGPLDENAPVVAAATETEAVVEEPVVEEPVVVEEEDITMTMEEYLAAKSASAAGESLFGSKKEKTIGENEFAGKAAHVAVEGNFLVMGDGKKVRKRAEKKEVQKLEVNFRVASADDSRPRDDGERGGRGRGGRGRSDGGRGRGGRGRSDGGRGRGDRGGRGGKRTGGRGGGLKVDDVNAFPTL